MIVFNKHFTKFLNIYQVSWIGTRRNGPVTALDLLRWNGRNGLPTFNSHCFKSIPVIASKPTITSFSVVSKSEETQAIHDSVDFQWHRKRQGNARINIQNDKLGKVADMCSIKSMGNNFKAVLFLSSRKSSY